jgi:FixJ family two-component response regulator
MTGLELARRLHEIRSDLALILYTGFGDGLAEANSDLARLCAVIPKPVDPALLRRTLGKCMSAAAADPHSPTVARPSAGATIRD